MIEIPLELMTLEVPNINKLKVTQVGNPFEHPELGLVQKVYYMLCNVAGKAFEADNKDIPMPYWLLIQKYILKSVTQEDIDLLNQFFVLADWPLTAVLPEVEVPVTEE